MCCVAGGLISTHDHGWKTPKGLELLRRSFDGTQNCRGCHGENVMNDDNRLRRKGIVLCVNRRCSGSYSLDLPLEKKVKIKSSQARNRMEWRKLEAEIKTV